MKRRSWVGARCLAGALAIAAAGCSRQVAWLDRRDQELPLVQRAAARATAGDVASAVRLYRKALAADPDAARAHLDLAFVLHDYQKDYVGAIYHYRRYLELRPDAQKRNMVEERIRLAEQLFAADVLGPSRTAAKVAALERENESLKARLQDLSSRWANNRRGVGTATNASAAAAAAPAPPGLSGSYRVKEGDTLSSIATAVYGDKSRWKEIQLANSDILGSSSQVRPGQVLVIP